MPRIILFLILTVTVFSCKTTPKHDADSTQTASQASSTNGLGLAETPLLPPPPVSGASLTVLSIEAEETHRDNLAVMQITVNKDLNADYARMWVCALGSTSDCTPTAANPMETASGIFNLFVIPSKSFTIYAQSCVDATSAYSPETPCGQVQTQDFVSSVSPLNPDKETAVLLAIQGEQNKIRTQCSTIRKTLSDYIAGNPGSSDLATLAQNQLSLTNVQLCAEFMGSDYYNVVKNAVSGTGTRQENNTAIALGLGTVSVLALATGIHGVWRLRNALIDKDKTEAKIAEAEKNKTALEDTISDETAQIKKLEEEAKNLAANNEKMDKWIKENTGKPEEDLATEIKKLAKFKEDLQTLTNELDVRKNAVAQFKAEIELSNKKIEDYKSKIAEYEQNRLSVAEKEKEEAAKKLEKTKLMDEKQKIESTITELGEKDKIVARKMEELQPKLNSLEEAQNNLRRIKPNVERFTNLMWDGINLEKNKITWLNEKDRINYGENPGLEHKNLGRSSFEALPFKEKMEYFNASKDWISRISYREREGGKNWGGNLTIYSNDYYLMARTDKDDVTKPFTDILSDPTYSTVATEEKNFSDIIEKYKGAPEELQKLIAEQKKISENLGALHPENTETAQKITTLQEKNKLLTQEISSLKEQISLHEKAAVNFGVETNRINQEIKRLTEQILQTETAITDLKAQTTTLTENIKTDVKIQISENESLLTKLGKQLEAKQKEKDALDAKKTKYLEENRRNLTQIQQNATSIGEKTQVLEKAKVALPNATQKFEKNTLKLEPKMKAVTSAKMQAGFGALIGVGAGVGAAVFATKMNLAGDAQTELSKTLNDAVTNIEESRDAIDTYWQQLSGK